MNNRAATINRDGGSHANHFAGVQESVFKDGFRDDGSTFGLRGKRHVLRLHVGGEAGIFLSGNIGGNQFVSIVNADGRSIRNIYRHTGGLQFGYDGDQVGGRAVGDGQIVIGDSTGNQKSTSLDAV